MEAVASSTSFVKWERVKERSGRCVNLKFRTGTDMLEWIRQSSVDLVDTSFTDPLGLWHHCTYDISQFQEETFVNGLAFDGSSVRLFQTVNKSDMFLKPDPTSCWVDPFADATVLHVTCNVMTEDGKIFSRCPRSISHRCEQYVQDLGIADSIFVGFEAEFFIFDSVRYSVTSNKVAFQVDCMQEASWNTDAKQVGGKSNLGYRQSAQRSYCSTPPVDKYWGLRSKMLLTMGRIGLPIEKHHHEVGSCQHELGLRFSTLTKSADMAMIYKYVVKNVAIAHELTATFMPKPIAMESGSGMHTHLSLWKDGKNLFYSNQGRYAQLSKIAESSIAGILKHARALMSFTNSSTNSYKRLVPGYEAPCHLSYSKGDRTAAIRIPVTAEGDWKSKRLEYRCPDPAGCPYLTFAAVVMAAIDGIVNNAQPPVPAERKAEIEVINGKNADVGAGENLICQNLSEALDALEKDHEFLLKGGVFTQDFIDAYIQFKRDELKLVEVTPHPKEYDLYYHC